VHAGQRRQSRGRDGRFKAGPPEVAGAQHTAERCAEHELVGRSAGHVGRQVVNNEAGIGTDLRHAPGIYPLAGLVVTIRLSVAALLRVAEGEYPNRAPSGYGQTDRVAGG
jgi:hypothetical protein